MYTHFRTRVLFGRGAAEGFNEECDFTAEDQARRTFLPRFDVLSEKSWRPLCGEKNLLNLLDDHAHRLNRFLSQRATLLPANSSSDTNTTRDTFFITSRIKENTFLLTLQAYFSIKSFSLEIHRSFRLVLKHRRSTRIKLFTGAFFLENLFDFRNAAGKRTQHADAWAARSNSKALVRLNNSGTTL